MKWIRRVSARVAAFLKKFPWKLWLLLLVLFGIAGAGYFYIHVSRSLTLSIKSSLKASEVEYEVSNDTIKIVVVFDEASSENFQEASKVYEVVVSKVKLWMAQEKLEISYCEVNILYRDKHGYRLENRRFSLS